MNEVYSFDFAFDEALLLEEWNEFYSYAAEAYVDERLNDPEVKKKLGDWDINNWKIAKSEQTKYSEQLCNFFDIEAEPRFYILKGGATLPPHQHHSCGPPFHCLGQFCSNHTRTDCGY